MAAPRKSIRGVIERGAHDLAFRIARSVEETLVGRAVGLAARGGRTSGNIVVTAEHIRHAVDEVLLDEACAKVGISLNGKKEIRPSKSRAG